MTEDLRGSLEQIAHGAAAALAPVELAVVRRRVRRRRVVRRTAGTTAALVVAASVGAAALTLGAVRSPAPLAPAQPTAQADPTASAAPTAAPVAGWVPGPAPCGSTTVPPEHDSTVVEVQGAVQAGDLDPATALFTPSPAGATVYLGITTTTDTPGEPAGDGVSHLQVLLVGTDGAVALWNDPARQLPQIDAQDGSGTSSVYGLYPAVDCRTGLPLDGTYRVVASDADETVELAPVTLGPAAAAGSDAVRGAASPDLPACGAPLPAATAQAVRDADLTVSLDPAVDLSDVHRAGLHVPVTLTAREGVSGLVPQGLRAFLVDDQGVVASGATTIGDASGGVTGTPFDVDAGGSFPAEVYQWFNPCPWPSTTTLEAGRYDLYVLDSVQATDGEGDARPRTIGGGPFPVTLTGGW